MTSDRVIFYDPMPELERVWDDFVCYLREIEKRDQWVAGPTVEKLESALAEYTGARHVVAVGSGTDGLIAALLAVGIGPGDEVIVPAYTFFASASSVVHVGARPVFVDITQGTYGIDASEAASAVSPRTKAIMPVHLFSQTADMAALSALAARNEIAILEDSAEAIGMRVNGVHAGLLGLAGVLSFFPTKTLGALGDAGAVLTQDPSLAERVRKLTQRDGSVAAVGLPSAARGRGGAGGWPTSCDEIQAAVLLAKLPRIEDTIAERAHLTALYDEMLAPLREQVSRPGDKGGEPKSSIVNYVYLVECERRDALVGLLESEGVETEIYYPRPLNEQPCFFAKNSDSRPTPVAKAASAKALALPLYVGMPSSHIERVCTLIHRFYRSPLSGLRSTPKAPGTRSPDGTRTEIADANLVAASLRKVARSGSLILRSHCERLESLLRSRAGRRQCVVVASPAQARILLDFLEIDPADAEIWDLGPLSPFRGIAEAAAILTDDEAVGVKLRMIRNHGQDGKTRFLHHLVGFNSRMDEVAASVLCERLGSANDPSPTTDGIINPEGPA